MFEQLLREHIKKLVIRPADSIYEAPDRQSSVLLNSNENAFGSPADVNYNRYPRTLQKDFIEKLASIKRVDPTQIYPCNGSEEVISRILSIFCEPHEDNFIICTPTIPFYEKLAAWQGVKIKKVPLLPDFQLDIERIAESVDNFTKIILLCSPNNPTGNSLNFQDLELVLHNFDGIVIVDEAYINFSNQHSLLTVLSDFPNLIVVQTLSKAWGLAGLRIGLAFANPEIVEVLNLASQAHPISQPSLEIAHKAIDQLELINSWIKDCVSLRNYLTGRLQKLPIVKKVYPSDANFLLVEFQIDARPLYAHLERNGYFVRYFPEIGNALRVTVGTLQENDQIIKLIEEFSK